MKTRHFLFLLLAAATAAYMLAAKLAGRSWLTTPPHYVTIIPTDNPVATQELTS